ncbi:hypothetical protein [uncultured Helicobacter sp.]|nr:hypothetical protein [uncultured Helicobacter sp.]
MIYTLICIKFTSFIAFRITQPHPLATSQIKSKEPVRDFGEVFT